MCNKLSDVAIHRYFSSWKCFFKIWNTWVRPNTKKNMNEMLAIYVGREPVIMWAVTMWIVIMWAVTMWAVNMWAVSMWAVIMWAAYVSRAEWNESKTSGTVSSNHRIIENKSWKNCCTIRVNKQIKHKHINNLKWWKTSAIEYLTPIKRKILIIFSIDVAGMRQRWRTFDWKWYEMEVTTKVTVNHVNAC